MDEDEDDDEAEDDEVMYEPEYEGKSLETPDHSIQH